MKQEIIWDYFQNKIPESFYGALPRLEYLAKICSMVKSGHKVLNIGVGSGGFELISKKFNLDVYSLDPNEESINNLRKNSSCTEKAKIGYSQQIPFPDSYFDAVVVSEVLEHLEDEILDTSLEEIYRILKKDGLVVGTVPAYEVLSDNTVVCPHCGEIFHRWGHVQSFDDVKLRYILSRKFKVEKLIVRHFPYYSSARLLSKIKLFVKDICWRVNIRTAGENIFFTARKK